MRTFSQSRLLLSSAKGRVAAGPYSRQCLAPSIRRANTSCVSKCASKPCEPGGVT
jgi:hypothetical protein